MWSVNFIAAIVVLVVITLICVAVIALTLMDGWTNDSYGWSEQKVVGIWTTVFLVFVLTWGALGLFPYSSEYHRYEPYEGNVVSIDKRIVSNGDGMQEKFVVNFGNGVQVGCEDTRCANVKAGDYLRLNCIKVWDFNASDGYDCKFGEWRAD